MSEAISNVVPFFASFTRATTAECLELADYLKRQGLKMIMFNQGGVVVKPVNEGEYVCVKTIVCCDDSGCTAEEFVKKLPSRETHQGSILRQVDALLSSLKRIGTELKRDWRTLTGDDCASYYDARRIGGPANV